MQVLAESVVQLATLWGPAALGKPINPTKNVPRLYHPDVVIVDGAHFANAGKLTK
jgi:hypothetical protein